MKSFPEGLTNKSIRHVKSFFEGAKHDSKNLFFQPKLTVGPANDVYEQEADRVAEEVVHGGHITQDEISGVNVQRKCAKCEEEEKLQRKERSSGDEYKTAPPSVEEVVNNPGSRMDEGTRHFMEDRFGYDFGDVKIHTDSKAAQSADSIDAHAYTAGNNIVFNRNQYAPQSTDGRRLLAHELTHVVQQSTGKVQTRRIQRECLRTAPGRDETPFTFERRGQRIAAEFSDAAGAESFIRGHSGQNLVCHRITRGRRTIFKVYQRNASGSSSAGGGTTTVQDEIFNDTEIARMQSFFIRNATDEDSLACINTVRTGISSLIYDDADLTDRSCPANLTMTAHNTMEETMAQLVSHNMASAVATIRFNDSHGHAISSGSGSEPMQLASSVWSALVTATGTATGWSVFGISLCDGYHSATITVDHRDRDHISMFWSDQTGNHPVRTADRISGISGDQSGWERMAQSGTSEIGTNQRGLDEYIRYAVRSFWGLHADEARGTTPLTHQQREGRDLGTCAPLIRLWRISRP